MPVVKDNKCSRNFNEKLHSMGVHFSRVKINMTPASREQCSRLQQSRWCRYWCFAAYTAAVTRNVLQPQKISRYPLIGDLVPLDHPSHTLKRHLDPFIHFCRAHEQTHKHTDHATPECSKRPHLPIATMPPNNSVSQADTFKVSLRSTFTHRGRKGREREGKYGCGWKMREGMKSKGG